MRVTGHMIRIANPYLPYGPVGISKLLVLYTYIHHNMVFSRPFKHISYIHTFESIYSTSLSYSGVKVVPTYGNTVSNTLLVHFFVSTRWYT